MSKKVQFVTGLLSGFIFPGLMWLIFDVWHKDWVLMDKPAVPYLVSIAVNLFILRYFIRNDKEAASQGLMLTTFALTILIFILKLKN